jgi:class 3 adenylate cyclase
MVEVRRELNQVARQPLDIGIGLATGQMVAGCIGSTDRLNYTVLGDRVNLGSRLCGSAGAMEVLLDDATKEAADAHATFEPVSGLRLKGIDEPVQAWRLVLSVPQAAAVPA